MYPVSSQRRYWTFGTEADIAELRRKQNEEYIAKHGGEMDVNKEIRTMLKSIIY